MGAGLLLGRIIQQQFHAEEEKVACMEMFLFFFVHDGRWETAALCVFVEKAFES